MKKLMGGLLAVMLVLPVFSRSAEAFSTSPLAYSTNAVSQLVKLPGEFLDLSGNGQIPATATIQKLVLQSNGDYEVSALDRGTNQTYSVTEDLGSLEPQTLLEHSIGSGTITKIQVLSGKAYRFAVTADENGQECVITVQFDTSVPRGFIGNGLPHNPQIVSTHGC